MWKGAIARNVGLLTAANLLMRGVGMLFQVYLTARVGAAGVGLLQLITAVQFFAMTLGTSGLRVAALTLTAEEYGYRRFGGVRQAMPWWADCCWSWQSRWQCCGCGTCRRLRACGFWGSPCR